MQFWRTVTKCVSHYLALSTFLTLIGFFSLQLFWEEDHIVWIKDIKAGLEKEENFLG